MLEADGVTAKSHGSKRFSEVQSLPRWSHKEKIHAAHFFFSSPFLSFFSHTNSFPSKWDLQLHLRENLAHLLHHLNLYVMYVMSEYPNTNAQTAPYPCKQDYFNSQTHSLCFVCIAAPHPATNSTSQATVTLNHHQSPNQCRRIHLLQRPVETSIWWRITQSPWPKEEPLWVRKFFWISVSLNLKNCLSI